MASGKVHNLGFTLVSTGDEGLTSDATAIGGNELASNLNKTLGGKNIVRASTDEMSGTQKRSGEEKAKVKVLDGYASAVRYKAFSIFFMLPCFCLRTLSLRCYVLCAADCL